MQTWTDKIDLGNGITCYRGVIKKEFDLINRLESTIGSVAEYGALSPEGKRYHWINGKQTNIFICSKYQSSIKTNG